VVAPLARHLQASEWRRLNRVAIRLGFVMVAVGLVLAAVPLVLDGAGVEFVAEVCHHLLGPAAPGGVITGGAILSISIVLFAVARAARPELADDGRRRADRERAIRHALAAQSEGSLPEDRLPSTTAAATPSPDRASSSSSSSSTRTLRRRGGLRETEPLVKDSLDRQRRFREIYDIFEASEQIQQRVIARAISGLRIE
jgi:hypothetical protein